MADRINASGYYLTPDGRPDYARSADHAHWQAVINDAWVKGHGKDVPIPTDYTIMVVEDGDCQWTIAEDAGADPVETAYTINKQFASNPDLIMKDQVVFLPPSTHYSVTQPAKYDQPGDPFDNADIFAEQTSTHVTQAWPNGDIAPVKADIHTYMDSVVGLSDTPASDGSASDRTQALQNILSKPSWGLSGDKGVQGRHLVLVDYFSRPGMNTTQNVKDLEVKLGVAQYNEHGEFIEKSAEQFKKEILAKPPADVMTTDGKIDDSKVNILVQQKVDLQADIKASAKEVGIKVEW